MRSAITLPAVLLLAACSVSKDPNNNSVTLGYDNGAVENGTRVVTTEAGKIAGDIAEDVKESGSKIKTKIDEQTADGNSADNAAANESANKH
ncbi:MAG: hypothetical protein ABIN68_05260 [Sphingomicrobium sp.]